ncbi:hypothetical protein FOA52_001100 [Chlamydomonas sp. UWO 241]|nr:hypothetical protein FOA52_001100 [Chlamydomonas sp. UWO 241]
MAPLHAVQNTQVRAPVAKRGATPPTHVWQGENASCPLCVEELDSTDASFYPCPCGYQVCLFCYGQLKDALKALCPGCRLEYGEPLAPAAAALLKHAHAAAAAAAADRSVKANALPPGSTWGVQQQQRAAPHDGGDHGGNVGGLVDEAAWPSLAHSVAQPAVPSHAHGRAHGKARAAAVDLLACASMELESSVSSGMSSRPSSACIDSLCPSSPDCDADQQMQGFCPPAHHLLAQATDGGPGSTDAAASALLMLILRAKDATRGGGGAVHAPPSLFGGGPVSFAEWVPPVSLLIDAADPSLPGPPPGLCQPIGHGLPASTSSSGTAQQAQAQQADASRCYGSGSCLPGIDVFAAGSSLTWAVGSGPASGSSSHSSGARQLQQLGQYQDMWAAAGASQRSYGIAGMGGAAAAAAKAPPPGFGAPGMPAYRVPTLYTH